MNSEVDIAIVGAGAALACAADRRILLAGEACSPHAFSTTHGAAQTGRADADQALAALALTPAGA